MEYYKEETVEQSVAEVIVAKNRHGSTGTVYLNWIGRYTTFYSIDEKRDDDDAPPDYGAPPPPPPPAS
jgi:replicative DNA helicase